MASDARQNYPGMDPTTSITAPPPSSHPLTPSALPQKGAHTLNLSVSAQQTATACVSLKGCIDMTWRNEITESRAGDEAAATGAALTLMVGSVREHTGPVCQLQGT